MSSLPPQSQSSSSSSSSNPSSQPLTSEHRSTGTATSIGVGLEYAKNPSRTTHLRRAQHHWEKTSSSAKDALTHAREALNTLVTSARDGGQPVVSDLKNVLDELDKSIGALKAEGSDQVVNLRTALQEHADRLRVVARDSVHHVRHHAARSVEYTQERVTKDPFKTLAVTLAVGALAGWAWGRCGSSTDVDVG